MNTISRKFYLLAPIALALVAAGTMPAQQTYTYTLNLPDISGSTEGPISGITENDNSFFQYEFSWLGPLEYNAPINSYCPNGCPVTGATPGVPAPGYAYGGVFFDASTNPGACSGSPSGGCSDVVLSYYFDPYLGINSFTIFDNLIRFQLIEPDSFWLNPTSSLSFADNPLGENGVGASFEVGIGGLEFGCSQCSVTIAATPEPGTWLLLAGSLAVLCVVLGRRAFRTV